MVFNKSKHQQKQQQFETALGGILDIQDTEILVVDPDDCSILYVNETAKTRLHKNCGCKDSYADDFIDLCAHCAVNAKSLAETQNATCEEEPEKPKPFQVENRAGELFRGYCRNIEWENKEHAIAIFLQNNSEEQAAKDKLYRLAYLDSLTGIPNRQRLKEDFENVAAEIAGGTKTGVMAIFDLDNFKVVNDTYGHNTGDILLRRIADHLNEEPGFKGHLYRLGGDEFVIFFAGGPDIDLEQHYLPILESTMLSYTMPNIDINCTISMGVSFFPKHGKSYTELLRKADIALYKAKESGRDQMVLFEDRYDTAKKFKDFYVTVQPILTAHSTTYAYEMSDMGSSADGSASVNTVLDGFDRTMDMIGLDEISTHNKDKYIIQFSNQLLNSSVRKNLPKEKFIISLPLAAGVDEKDIEKYRLLRRCGYQLAIMDLPAANVPPVLLELVDFCMFAKNVDVPTQKQIIAKYPSKKFIARDINTAQELEQARTRGFVLFQGYFFGQPQKPKKKKDIDPMKSSYFRLLKLTSTDDYTDFKEISHVISSDVALSYKLLQLLNSAAVGLTNRISSIDMGVAYLGEENLKKWISLLALRGIADGTPLELVRVSLIRAQFGELLAPEMTPKRNKKHVFMVGLFSLLHIALERPQDEVLNEIPLADDIKESLLTSTGPYSDLLQFYTDYEYANWDDVAQFARENQLTDSIITNSYIKAIKWYDALAEESNAI